jgi:hypothetical protein
MATNNQRTIPGGSVKDFESIENLTYNDSAGSRKVSEVGRHLVPFPYASGASILYTTNLTTILPLPKPGMGLAVYNNDTVIHAVTLGEASTQSALAAGVTDATGHVGIACAPAAWTYVATAAQGWVITNSANLLVYLIDDNSYMQNQNPGY